MSAYAKGKRVVRKANRTVRKAKRTGSTVGGALVAIGVLMAIEGHVLGGAGTLSPTMAVVGDASAVLGLGIMLKQACR